MAALSTSVRTSPPPRPGTLAVSLEPRPTPWAYRYATLGVLPRSQQGRTTWLDGMWPKSTPRSELSCHCEAA